MNRLAVLAFVLGAALWPRAASAQTGDHGIEALAMAARFADAALSDVYGSQLGLGARYVYGRRRWSIAGEVGWRNPEGRTSEFGFESELRVVHAAALVRIHLPLGRAPDSAWTFHAGAGILHQRLRERVDFAGELLEASDAATGVLVAGGVRRRIGPSWGLTAEGRYAVPGTPLDTIEFGGGVWVRF